jgi:hypothetical protein
MSGIARSIVQSRLLSDGIPARHDGAAESRLHEAAWIGDLDEVTGLVKGAAT